MLQSLHQSVELLRAAALCRKLFQPLAKHGIERFVLRFGQQARLLNQLLIGTQGNVSHTKIVYTIIVQLSSTLLLENLPALGVPFSDFAVPDAHKLGTTSVQFDRRNGSGVLS